MTGPWSTNTVEAATDLSEYERCVLELEQARRWVVALEGRLALVRDSVALLPDMVAWGRIVLLSIIDAELTA